MGSMATVVQFPIRLAHAITAHKIQGNTIPFPAKVLVDLSSVFEPAQAYVMLSRVQCIDQVYIYKELKEDKIRTSEIALEELRRLKKISLNENPQKWSKDTDGIRIAFVNCAGLIPHLEDIKTDNKLLKADILHLDETHLEVDTSYNIDIKEFRSHCVNVGKGKGIVSYIRTCMTAKISCVKEARLQIVKVSLDDLDSINLYRSTNYSLDETWDVLNDMIDLERTTLITGDFNVCLRKSKMNTISSALSNCEFSQIQHESTQIMGGQIDHVYWRDPSGNWNMPILERHSPYFTDHEAFLLTLTKRMPPGSRLKRRRLH